jgi:hypothetical protein
MKKSTLVSAMLALIPGAVLAGTFDGTWKFDPTHLQMSQKPLVFLLADGSFTCSSCVPNPAIKADGTDQKVAGSTFDTVAVTVVGPNEIDVVRKLKGKTVESIKSTISANGNTLARESTDYTGTSPVVSKLSMKRVAPAPAGAHAISGSWVATKLESISDSGILETFSDSDDGFTMSANGQSYDAKFDGKKYPVTGDPAKTMVVLKRVGPNEVVETDFRKGKIDESIDLKVSADGKTINVTDTDIPTHRTDHFKLFKQP